jgi:hypothetical protein
MIVSQLGLTVGDGNLVWASVGRWGGKFDVVIEEASLLYDVHMSDGKVLLKRLLLLK